MERQSEWHEEVKFSDLYFAETKKCREAQVSSPEDWAIALLSKISMAGGVLKREDVSKLAEKIEGALNVFYYGGINVRTNVANTIRQYKLIKALREVEQELDSKVNKKMPFLNIQKEIDITDF